MTGLGAYLKFLRESLHSKHSGYSIRCVAKRVGMHHSYLSKVERGERDSLDERRLEALARELGENPELLLALSGKLSPRISRCLSRHPNIFREFLAKVETCEADKDAAYYRTLISMNRTSELEELARRLRDEITHRKALEYELKQAIHNYRALFDFLPDAVVLADIETGKILDVNKAAVRLWKKSRTQLIGIPQSALHPQDGNEDRSRKFKVHGTKELSHEVNTEILDGDGEIVPVFVAASRVIFNDRPSLIGLFRRHRGKPQVGLT